MLSKRGPQGRLFEAGWRYGDFVGQDTFYGFMAQQRDIVFADDKFADLYCLTNGRPSVLPSVLAMALVLQTHDRVADEEARQRATYDLRWKVARASSGTCSRSPKARCKSFGPNWWCMRSNWSSLKRACSWPRNRASSSSTRS